MSEIISLVYAEDAARAADLRARFEATSGVASVTQTHDLSELAAQARDTNLDAIVLALGDDAEAAFAAVEALPQPRPAIVFLGEAGRSEWILRAMRLGAREYLPTDADAAALGALVERIGSARERGAQSGSPATVLGVVGAKGGVGTTVVACQLAARLQQLGHDTCLVDLNLKRGDIAIHYDLSSYYSLAEVARTRKRVDASFVESLLSEHASGVSVIAAPERPEDGELVNAEHVAKALRLLRTRFRCIVIDLPTPWDEPGLRALDLLDALLLVTTSDLASLAQTRRQLELLERIGVPKEHVQVLANRMGSRESIREKDAVDYLGRGIDYTLPNDFVATSACIHSGGTLETVAGHSALAAAVRNLADRLAELHGLGREPARALADEASGGRFAAAFGSLASIWRRSEEPPSAAPAHSALVEGAAEEAAPEDDAQANGSLRTH